MKTTTNFIPQQNKYPALYTHRLTHNIWLLNSPTSGTMIMPVFSGLKIGDHVNNLTDVDTSQMVMLTPDQTVTLQNT